MACLQIYRELLSLSTFHRVHSNSEEVSYLFWENTYPNLKTTRHIKLKFFLWTKVLENLLLANYLISVATPLKARYALKKWIFLLENIQHQLKWVNKWRNVFKKRYYFEILFYVCDMYFKVTWNPFIAWFLM